MYVHVGATARDLVAKARVICCAWSDKSGNTAGRAGVFFSACNFNLHNPPPTCNSCTHTEQPLSISKIGFIPLVRGGKRYSFYNSLSAGCTEVNCKLHLLLGHPVFWNSKNGFKIFWSCYLTLWWVFLNHLMSESNCPGRLLWQKGVTNGAYKLVHSGRR